MDFNGKASELFEVSCYLAIAIASAGLVLNLVLIVAIRGKKVEAVGDTAPHSKKGSKLPFNDRSFSIDTCVCILAAASFLYGFFVILDNILYLAGRWYHLRNPAIAISLSCCGYLFFLGLFAANGLLSLERFWLIKYGEPLKRIVVVYLFLFMVQFWICIAVSFFLIHNFSDFDWYFLPFSMPGKNASTASKALFITGLSFFALVVIGTTILYENTYFLAQDMVATAKLQHQEFCETHAQSRPLESQIPNAINDTTEAEEDTTGNKVTRQSTAQFRILIRCIFMSIGFAMANPNRNTARDVSPSTKHTVDAAACVIAATCILGVLLCALLLPPLLLRRKDSLFAASGIGRSITHILFATLVHGLLMATVNIVWVVNVGVLNLPSARYFFVMSGYLLPIWVFMSNIRLALERLWLVQYSKDVRCAYVYLVYGAGLAWSSFFVAAFVLLNDAPDWLFWPFSMPGSKDRLINTLFLTGMAIFPVSCLIIVAIYVRLYLVTASVLSAARSEMIESDIQSSNASCSSMHVDESRKEMQDAVAATVAQQRTVFVRCVVMAAGTVVLYLPTIVYVMVRVAVVPDAENMDDGNAWLCIVLNVLPALDVLYTPMLVFWFQPELRRLLADYVMNTL
ncbi:hypothetical protein HDU81_006319 [Chytriomyces hyalinus]|nr:hypothetical protein HDU81_006319 [Chytriomyces hyalinus]